MPKKPTLRDIAARADVALSTVSQVLNHKANVSPDMRTRVLKAASELGYRQKIEAHSLTSAQISTVGLLTKRLEGTAPAVNPFYSPVIAGVEHECQRHHLNLMYANIEVDEHNHAINLPSMLLNEQVDGVIVVGAFLEKSIAEISRRAKSNVVLVDSYSSRDLDFDSVVIDNFNGAFSAMAYLISNNHRRIGLIGSSAESYPSVLERRRGYFSALTQHGLSTDYVEEGELSRASGYESTLKLLRRCPTISAIFACNDETAFGVMSAARQLGYSLPDDLSIVGFDDIDLAQEVMPPLTTVHVDKVLMGTVALRMLRDRAIDPTRSALKTVVPTQLISRGSVRKLEG